MEEKITTSEEYNLCLQHKKQIRDKMFNLKLEIFMNQKDLEKSKLLKEEYKTLKRNYTLLSFKIC